MASRIRRSEFELRYSTKYGSDYRLRNLLRTARWQNEQQRGHQYAPSAYSESESQFDRRGSLPPGAVLPGQSPARRGPYGHAPAASYESFDIGGRAHASRMSLSDSNEGYSYPPSYNNSPVVPPPHHRAPLMARRSTEELMHYSPQQRCSPEQHYSPQQRYSPDQRHYQQR
jgi:hypothetical protein